MIEALMFYALGVLSAGIVALLIGPPLWRRAVRLAQRAIEQTLPMTHAEIQAEKDQIRAAFAVSTRRLDAMIERLEGQVADQLIDLNRKREIIKHLTAEGSMSAEDMIALEKQRDELLLTVAAREAALAEAGKKQASAEWKAAEIEAQLKGAAAMIETMVSERETQRLEIVARDTELDNLRDSVAAVKTTSTVGEVERAGLETEMSELRANLAMEKHRTEETENAAAEAEAKRIAVLAELAGRETDLVAARQATAAAQSKIEELSLRLVEAEAAGMAALAIEESKAEMEGQLSHLQTVNTRLETELAELRAAGAKEDAKAGEHETELLRGKLIEIGAAVARLSAKTDGPSLVPLIVESGDKAMVPAEPQPSSEPAVAPISLAARIRALQHASGGS